MVSDPGDAGVALILNNLMLKNVGVAKISMCFQSILIALNRKQLKQEEEC